MPDRRISQLDPAGPVTPNDLLVIEQNGAALKLSGETLMQSLATRLAGHGGISNITYTPPVAPSLVGTLTISLADGEPYSVPVTNGNGIDSVEIRYGISNSGTDPSLVQSWSAAPTVPTNQYPYGWTRITITDITGVATNAYSITTKASDPNISVGNVTAVSGDNPSASVTNSGTTYNPVLNFDFTFQRGEKGDTGDYIVPVVSYGTSTAAASEPSTWYNDPSSISYSGGNFIWRKIDYTLYDTQAIEPPTVQSTVKEIVGYIAPSVSGTGTVTQITFNGTVYADDGTGNVPMTIDAEDVGAIANPTNKNDGQVLTYDDTAHEWVAANPATGNVNTVNNVGVDVGTTNITLYASSIKMSSSDNTTIPNAIPSASSATPQIDGTGAAGSGTTWARGDHVHPLNVPSGGTPANLGTASNGSSSSYARSDHVHAMPSAADVGAFPVSLGTPTAPTGGNQYWTSISGGFWQFGKIVFVQIKANYSGTFKANDFYALATNMPLPANFGVSLSVTTSAKYAADVKAHIRSGGDRPGQLIIKSGADALSNANILVTGMYISA